MRISEGLEKIINGLGIARDNAEAEAKRLAELYPDAAEFESQFVAWLKNNADQALDPANLAGTLAGIARDIFAGVAGKDPRAHQGNV